MKIRITSEIEIDLYHADGIVESSETTMNEDDEFEVISLGSEGDSTKFAFPNGDCFDLPNENFEVLDETKEVEYQVAFHIIKVHTFKAKSIEEARALAESFDWTRKPINSTECRTLED